MNIRNSCKAIFFISILFRTFIYIYLPTATCIKSIKNGCLQNFLRVIYSVRKYVLYQKQSAAINVDLDLITISEMYKLRTGIGFKIRNMYFLQMHLTVKYQFILNLKKRILVIYYLLCHGDMY